MSIWLWPLIIVILGIILISYYSTVAVARHQAKNQVLDKGVSEKIQQHPFMLNPLLWSILLAALFIGFVIFYYAVVYTF